MAQGPGKHKGDKESSTAEYYKLKTEAVEDLATANEDNSPPVSQAELERYGARKTGGIPNWLKLNFIKFWFPASICWFFVNGLGIAFPLDIIVIVGIVMGMVTDLLTNNALRFFAETEGANDVWMMFPARRYVNFILNILYSMVLMVVLLLLYKAFDAVSNLVMGTSGVQYLKMGPISFGLFYLTGDSLFLAVKYWIKKLLLSRKNKNV